MVSTLLCASGSSFHFNWLNQTPSLIFEFMGFNFFFHFSRKFCTVFTPPNFVMKTEGDVKVEMLRNTTHQSVLRESPYHKVNMDFLSS